MKIVPIDNILARPLIKITKEGVISINKAMAILANPNNWEVTEGDIRLSEIEDWHELKPKSETQYLHIYIVEADAHRIAISLDDDPVDGLELTYYSELEGYPHTPYEEDDVPGYAQKSKSLVRWLTNTFEYKFDTHPWYYHRIENISKDNVFNKRIVRMI